MNDVINFFKKHPGILGSLIYCGVSAIGLYGDLVFYRTFKVNILDFAEIDYFLLAAFKVPVSILVTTLIIMFSLIAIHRLRAYYTEHSRAKTSPQGPSFLFSQFGISKGDAIILAILSTCVIAIPQVTYKMAQDRAKLLMDDKSSRVLVDLGYGDTSKASETKQRVLVLLGTTRNYMFFFAPNDKATHVVAKDQIFGLRFGPLPSEITPPHAESAKHNELNEPPRSGTKAKKS